MKTYGWDIVSACSSSKINSLLKARMIKTPPKITYSDGGGVSINAVLGPWKINDTGSTHKLSVEIPIVSGTMANASKFANFKNVDLADVKMEFSIPLAFLDNASTQTADLTFNLKTKATSANDTSDGAVFCVNPDLTGTLAKIDPLGNVATALSARIVDALVANSARLSFALSSVNVAPKADWMVPKDKGHMFVPGPKKPNGAPGDGYLVVVTMVRDLPANTRSMNVDPSLFASGSDFATLFAGDLFMEHFVFPGIGKGFVNDPQKDFSISGTKITGTGPIQCADHMFLGIAYTPMLDTITLDIDDVNLVIKSSGQFHLTELQKSAHVSITMTKYATLDIDPGTDHIKFTEPDSPASTSDYSKHIPFVDFVIAVPLFVALGPFIPVMITAILDGVLVGVTNAVSRGVTNSAGTGGIGDLGTISVAWPGSTSSTVKNCGIAGNFWMCGDVS